MICMYSMTHETPHILYCPPFFRLHSRGIALASLVQPDIDGPPGPQLGSAIGPYWDNVLTGPQPGPDREPIKVWVHDWSTYLINNNV